jgi:hypothetical protein
MPCKGTAHIQHSEAAEESVDLETGTPEIVRVVDGFVSHHVHIRSHPEIRQPNTHTSLVLIC